MRPMNQRTVETAISQGGRMKCWVATFIWVTGLLLAGSDSPWMPYINGVGGVLFLTATLWLAKILPSQEFESKSGRRHERDSKQCFRRCRPLTPCVSAICSKAIT